MLTCEPEDCTNPPRKKSALEEASKRDSTASGEARQRTKPHPTIPGPEGGAATAPCSNGMRGSTARRVPPPGMTQFPVGHSHKQGLELITPGMDLQWMGGKKP